MYSIHTDDYLVSRDVFQRYTWHVARDMLGMYVVRYYSGQWLVGRIVETECYTSDDPACHAYRGKTARNASLFGPVGHAYVYIIYGIHMCLNVVAYNPETHVAGGVLIRAIEPVYGEEVMYHNRRIAVTDRPAYRLTNGPGKVTQALHIDHSYDGCDLCCDDELYLRPRSGDESLTIQATPRVGISQAQNTPWRFIVSESNYVS